MSHTTSPALPPVRGGGKRPLCGGSAFRDLGRRGFCRGPAGTGRGKAGTGHFLSQVHLPQAACFSSLAASPVPVVSVATVEARRRALLLPKLLLPLWNGNRLKEGRASGGWGSSWEQQCPAATWRSVGTKPARSDEFSATKLL